jgi:hypothetical protein
MQEISGFYQAFRDRLADDQNFLERGEKGKRWRNKWLRGRLKMQEVERRNAQPPQQTHFTLVGIK